ncbi:hypothetical protein HYQ44_002077 [Verticillium longisporum]|nr:hypothetical protein HYQ44_002077 [Verticillium longisporum]
MLQSSHRLNDDDEAVFVGVKVETTRNTFSRTRYNIAIQYRHEGIYPPRQSKLPAPRNKPPDRAPPPRSTIPGRSKDRFNRGEPRSRRGSRLALSGRCHKPGSWLPWALGKGGAQHATALHSTALTKKAKRGSGADVESRTPRRSKTQAPPRAVRRNQATSLVPAWRAHRHLRVMVQSFVGSGVPRHPRCAPSAGQT